MLYEGGKIIMYSNKTLSVQNLSHFDFEETKKNVTNYFANLEKLEWEWAKLNAQKGLIANYDFMIEYKKQPYIPIGKDFLNLSIKECKEEQLKKYISNYYWARSTLSDTEQQYITECFVNRKYEDELAGLLGLGNSDSNEFRKLKRSAVYKFADFLDLIVEKK